MSSCSNAFPCPFVCEQDVNELIASGTSLLAKFGGGGGGAAPAAAAAPAGDAKEGKKKEEKKEEEEVRSQEIHQKTDMRPRRLVDTWCVPCVVCARYAILTLVLVWLCVVRWTWVPACPCSAGGATATKHSTSTAHPSPSYFPLPCLCRRPVLSAVSPRVPCAC